MKGTISTNQKCSLCGGVLKYIEGKGILRCLNDPDVIWNLNCFVRFGRKHTKRFKTVFEAERHLTYLRAQTDHDVFDIRDWQKNAPLSFLVLREKFVKTKELDNVGQKQLRHIEYVLNLAGEQWDKMNIKAIGEGEIDDFFARDFGVSNKTLANYKSVLTDFWTWVVRRERRFSKIEMPLFPDIKYKLKMRKIVKTCDQIDILDEVKKITWPTNPRIWLGIRLMAWYPKVRPGEMVNVLEGHINLHDGWIVFPQPKEREPKYIVLLPEHVEIIQNIRDLVPRAMPDMPFFRHLKSRSGVKAGVKFGPKYFNKWWNKACKNLGIEGVSVYPGVKHSTVTPLGMHLSPEQIQNDVTGHASDAFKRYYLPDKERAVYATRKVAEMQSKSDPHVIHIKTGAK
ncbi:MAG: hypothetical protein MI862_01440 [Desulfobacterales bacterium]|nr:hypothetical protein [Desulfobacterales bacterium]